MMPTFEYKAKLVRGGSKEGEIDAPNKNEAKTSLKKMGYIVTSLKISKNSIDEGEETPIIGDFLFRDVNGKVQINLGSQAPTTKDLIVFTKQFATMLGSGVPMIQALGILGKQQSSRGFTKCLKQVQYSVENGQTLSDSMKEFDKIFDNLYIAMIEAGEASGSLDVILGKLVTYIEKASKIKDQVKSAMMYPLMVLIVAITVVTGLLVFVVPTFAEQYADGGRKLPELTQVVIDFSNFFGANWYFIFGGLGGFVALFIAGKRTAKGEVIFDKYILKAPIIGDLLRKIAVGRFCSTMASMLISGVNLLEALSICAASSGNKTVENFVLNIRKSLEKGSKFSEPLSEGDLFPDMVISMVTVGEATGALDDMLEKVSDYYEEEVDLAVATMLSMIEPIMIVGIGGIIAFIVVAMYLPIFDMAGGVG